jgi:putative redox protein
MTSSTPKRTPITQAVVTGGLDDDAALTGHVGASEFPIGGPDGRGGLASGPNPYDLLSASLAACTAMTIRLHARHKKYPLSHFEVAVSYHHTPEGGRGSFERAITLQGSLDDDQRAQLLRGANMCPVGKTLGLIAEIHTRWTEAADGSKCAGQLRERPRRVFGRKYRSRLARRSRWACLAGPIRLLATLSERAGSANMKTAPCGSSPERIVVHRCPIDDSGEIIRRFMADASSVD